MKAVLAILAPALLLAVTPALSAAADEDAQLEQALVDAGRKALSVAPWVKLTVENVTVGDRLQWTLMSSAGQLYACDAPADADALMSGKAACARAKLSAEALAAQEAVSNARLSAGRQNKAEANMMTRDRLAGSTTSAGGQARTAASIGR